MLQHKSRQHFLMLAALKILRHVAQVVAQVLASHSVAQVGLRFEIVSKIK